MFGQVRRQRGGHFGACEEIGAGNFGQVRRLRGVILVTWMGIIWLYLVLTLSFTEIIFFAIFKQKKSKLLFLQSLLAAIGREDLVFYINRSNKIIEAKEKRYELTQNFCGRWNRSLGFEPFRNILKYLTINFSNLQRPMAMYVYNRIFQNKRYLQQNPDDSGDFPF